MEAKIITNKKIVHFLIIVCALCCFLTSCDIPNLLKGDGLYSAVVSGNLERVKEAVEDGADVNKGSMLYALHENPLLYSINNSYLHIAEYLLSQGANPNYIDKRNGISILMYTVGAICPGLTYGNASHYGVYRILLNDERTDVNIKGKLGYTALDYACRDNGQLEIVNDLINHGAKITATTMKCAFEGYKNGFCEESVIKLVFDSLEEQKIPSVLSPEIEAALQGDSSKLIPLIRKITQENKQLVLYLTCAFGDVEALSALCDETVKINEIRWPRTLLSVACKYGNIEAVKYLVNKQADIEISTYDDWTSVKPPLTYALEYNHLDIADYLFESGAKLQIAKSGTSGGRPDSLEIACKNGSLDTVKWVIEHGYPLDEERIAQSMSEAARNDHIDVLKYFLEDLEVDINSEYYHSTVLSAAKNFEMMRFLLDNGADVNGGRSPFTPLDRAVMDNQAYLVQYLLDNGADADIFYTYDDGNTSSRPLTVAIQNGFFDIVKILVDHGVELEYHEGWSSGEDTPVEIATNRGSKNILNYIENALNDKSGGNK